MSLRQILLSTALYSLVVIGPVQASDVAPSVALLSSSCAACHGTNGHAQGDMPSLAGLEPSYFIQQMQDFRNGVRPSTVMQQQASGYSENEIRLMATFFAKQK